MKHNRLQELRKRAGLTQRELADKLGVTQQTIWYYENGRREMKSSVLVAISRALGCSVSELLGLTPDEGVVRMRAVEAIRVPVVGRVAAGTPRDALSQSDEYHDTPRSLVDDRDGCFWLRVSGNSMNRLFPDGALVLVDPGADIHDGDVGVVSVNGDDATCKRVFFTAEGVRLHPESWDPEYRDLVIRSNDPDAPTFHAIGRVVSYTAPDGWHV